MSSLKIPLVNQHGRERVSIASSTRLAEYGKKRDTIVEDEMQFFAANYDAVWTISDQTRLVAIDQLHSRNLEFHNNVHKRDLLELSRRGKNDSTDMNAIDLVAQILKFVPNSTLQQRPRSVTMSKLSKSISIFQQHDKVSDFLWINLVDTTSLPYLAKRFNIHPLCVAGFYDLRANTSIIPTENASLISLCYFQLDNMSSTVSMFKMYLYLTKHLVITLEVEIMADVDSHDGNSQGYLIENACSSVLARWEHFYSQCCQLGPMYLFYEIITQIIQLQDPMLEFISRSLFYFKKHVNEKLVHREKIELIKKMHTIQAATAMVQRNLDKNKQIIIQFMQNSFDHDEISESDSMKLSFSGIDNVERTSEASGSQYSGQMPPKFGGLIATRGFGPTSADLVGNLMTSSISGNMNMNMNIGNRNSAAAAAATAPPPAGHEFVMAPSQGALWGSGVHIIRREHVPYLADLLDSFTFTHEIIFCEMNECERLKFAMDTINTLRTNNATMMLSLIATVFLPVTFLTGVFGMNFSVGASYTIDLVNLQDGPLVFYCMCAFCFLTAVSFFFSQGWLEPFGLVEMFIQWVFKKCGRCSHINERKLEAAHQEDKRRVQETTMKRSQALVDSQRQRASRGSLLTVDELRDLPDIAE